MAHVLNLAWWTLAPEASEAKMEERVEVIIRAVAETEASLSVLMVSFGHPLHPHAT